ncbi:MAG: RagB/SusD family nutrient uptake outer membrane protein [Bacteroidales bacterium]|nr:RagB/SusD family nutrient uptake outer membrane protein [Bacteroidales bacterium]
MKKHIISLSALVLASLVFAGCEKFLDTVSYTERNTSNFPASEEDAMQLVTGIYATMNLDLRDFAGTCYIMQANLCSDDCYGGGGMDDSETQAWDHLMYNDIDHQADFWTNCYSGIGRANMAISALDKVEDEDLRNQLLGEAYILRSWFYFELAQMFEIVPLVTTVPESVADAAEYPALATVEEIYGFIAASLKIACDNMPSTPYGSILTGRGHVNRWVAEGLLARVYLFYTGFYSDKEGKSITTLPLMDLETNTLSSETIGKDYVVSKLEDCIKNSGYSLVPDFRCLWTYSNKATKPDYPFMDDCADSWYMDAHNPEQMFHINAAKSSHKYNYLNYYCGLRTFDSGDYKGVFPMSRGYGFATVNPDLWNTWDENDIRRKGSIWSVWEEALDFNSYQFGAESQMEETGLWQKKIHSPACYINGKWSFEFTSISDYYGADKDLGRKKATNDFTLLRFADVLLMHAELTDGKVIYNGMDGMNAVRARAKLPQIAYSVDALRQERRHELAFEAIRWGDMRRYGKAYCIAALETQLGGRIWNTGKETTMKDQGPGYKARYEATWGFRPYPQMEISLSNGVLTQRPGWDSASALYTSWK